MKKKQVLISTYKSYTSLYLEWIVPKKNKFLIKKNKTKKILSSSSYKYLPISLIYQKIQPVPKKKKKNYLTKNS